MNSFWNVVDGGVPRQQWFIYLLNFFYKYIYCKVIKSNGVKSRVTLDKTTSLQVKSI